MEPLDGLVDKATKDQFCITLANGNSDLTGQVASFYRRKVFCDATIICKDGVSIPVHRLVLASASTWLKDIMEAMETSEQDIVFLVPDHNSQDVALLLDNIYCSAIVTGTRQNLAEVTNVGKTLEMDYGQSSVLNANPLQESIDEEFDDFFLDVKVENDAEQLYPDSAKCIPAVTKKKCGSPKDEDLPTNMPTQPTKRKTFFKKKNKRKCFHRPKRYSYYVKAPIIVDDDLAHEKRQVFDKLFQLGKGQLTVDIDCTRKSKLSIASFAQFQEGCIGGALIGVRTSGENLVASPLVWTPLDISDNEIVDKYVQYCEGLKCVFGFSDAEVYANRIVKSNMGFRQRIETREKTVRRNFAAFSPEKLKEILQDEEIASANKTGHLKPFLQNLDDFLAIKVTRGEATDGPKPETKRKRGGQKKKVPRRAITFDMNSNIKDFEAIVFFSYDVEEKLQGCFLHIDDFEKHRQDVAEACIFSFFHVLHPQKNSNIKSLRICPKISETFERFITPYYKYKVATEFLNDPSKAKALAQDMKCPECEEVFPMKSGSDHKKFEAHMREHPYMNNCTCENTWGNDPVAKRNHVLIVHMGRVKCDSCTLISTPNAVASHYDYVHRPVTCEYCGEPRTGLLGLENHVKKHHPEYASERLLKRKDGRAPGTCHICGKYFKQIKLHLRNVHSDNFVICPHCGKKLRRSSLKEHVIWMHTPKAHVCKYCEER